MATEAVWYDIFRNLTLKVKSDGSTIDTIVADEYKDTLTINQGLGVAFNPSAAGDEFDIDVDYQLYVPVGTTTVRLQDVNSNTRDVKLTPGSGVFISRLADDELAFTSYGVAENDNLHTVTKRGAITTNKLIINDLEIGDITSTPGVDGFSVLGVEFQGDGTLDNPARLLPAYVGITDPTYTKTYEFSVGAAGIFGYSASYLPPLNLTTGSIVLEREDPLNPGVWAPIAQQSGTTAGVTYQLSNTYAESYTGGTVNYRITVSWTGNTSQVRVDLNLTYEVYDVATNVLLETDTANNRVFLSGNVGIDEANPLVSLVINRTDAIALPKGITAEQPTGADGYIRYNTQTNKFEGFSNGFWNELGSVSDVDLDTYITAELNPGTDDDTLYFYNAFANSLSLSSTLLDVKNDVLVRINNTTDSTNSTTGALIVDGGASIKKNLTVGSSNTNTVTFNSRVASSFVPEVTATHALGEDALRWSELFVSDAVNVNDYTLPLADGTVNQIVQTDAQGQLFFGDADTFGGNRVYVSAAKGDDANDGITAPVATIARAARIAADLAYSPETTDPTTESETAALRAAAQSIADDTITYVNTTYPTLIYDQAKCNRDVKEIIDSAIYDLRFGGNSRSVAAGEYYYDGTGTLYITGQVSETIDAINYAKSLAITYLTGTRATAIGASFDTVTSIITSLGNAPAKTYGDFITNQITIMVASGDYVEQNPILLGDDISIVGDNLRRTVIRPANENLDMFRVRNSSYITGVVFRDGLVNRIPDYTFRYAISFDNVVDTATSRAGYVNLPVSRPRIFTSPYIQNCSVISFLGGNGVEIDGNLIDTPNIPNSDIEAENPIDLADGVPEQGKSMVANAFTILSFGGVAWRVMNEAYAQIVSCFVIFTGNGCIAQNGGYLSITNSASNFGLFALRASGYSPNAFEFDRGIISGNGIYEVYQTLKFVGLQRAPLEHFIVRVRNNSNIDITDNFNNNSTFGNTASVVPTISNVSGNTITFASAHGFQSGEEVEYNSNGNVEIVGLLNEMTYFVSVPNTTQIQIFNDADFTKPVVDLDASPTSGTHEFKSGYEEFYVTEVVSSHNIYQTLTIPAGTYTITPGDTIQATDGADTISATIYSYDSGTNELVVSVELVQSGQTTVRNEFTTNSVIDAGEIAGGTVNVLGVANRRDLYSSEVAIISTENRPMQTIGSTAFNQIYLHRPSIVNSSAHTWEYAGSGTDYNALPQNGGQTVEYFEQVSTLPGRVYTSGTNELGDFKVGDFVRAFNRTGNINFKNKVSIGELDSLALSLSSGVVVDEISTDIDLGDNEIGGPQHSRLVTQLAARSFIDNRLGNFIDQNLSTNAVPNAVVQLNGQGQINAELIPPSSGTSAFRLDEYNARLELHEDIPSNDLKSGDIVIEEYQETVINLTGNVTVVAGETVTQANSAATGTVKTSVTNGSTIRVIAPFSGTFNLTDELTGSTSGALGANSVPTVVSGPNDVTDNYFLATANASQFLVLDPADTYDFTDIIANSTPVTGALTGATGTATEHRTGVVTSVDVNNLLAGSGYLTPGAYNDVALTSVTGTGTGALADIVVNGAGQVDSIDITFGGSGYAVGDELSAADNDIGGQGGGGTDFSVDVLSIENRLYIDLEPTIGIQFNASDINVEFTVDDNATDFTINQTAETNFGFDAADVGVGGDVTYSNSRITLTAHGMADGDPVRYDSGANPTIGSLTNGDTYFVKVIDADTIELYTNYGLNSKVTFISSSTGSHQLKIDFVNLTDEFFYAPAHGLTAGQAIQFNATTPVVGITDGDYLFAGSITTNAFTLHSARGSALDSVNGITVNPVNLTADGSGNATITIQNVEIVGEVNTSGKEESSWSNLSATTIDAEDIVSGIVSTSRLATGSANNLTVLRGDSTWSFAVQGMVPEFPVTLTGQSYNDGVKDVYYNEVEVSVELANYDNPVAPSAGTETVGVAAFDFNHFNIDANGLVTTKTPANGGVIDADKLDGQQGSYYLNPVNLSRAVPIENGGTNLSSYTQGDLLYAATNIGTGSFTETLSTLAIGAANSVLQSNGTVPTWTDTLTLADLTVGNIQVAVTGDNEIDTTSGNLTLDSAGGTVEIDDNLTVAGNLTVNGTTTTVNSTTVTIDDPIFTLGGDTVPTTDDNKDRGIEFRWYDTPTTTAKVGFFGFDDSTGKFTFIPDATNTNEVFSGTAGDVAFNDGAFTSITSGSITVTGDTSLEGNVTLGNAAADRITFTGQIATDLVFQGATDDTFTTTLAITDPTTPSNTITFPDASGTVAVSVTDTTTTTQGDLNLDFTLSAAGNVSATGDAHGLATGDSPTFAGLTINGSSVVFEGATANDFETTLTVTDPTADRTITFPNADGTVVVSAGTSATQSGLDLSISAAGQISGSAEGLAATDSPTFAGLTINGNTIVLEGATEDAFETTLNVVDPTATRTINIPNNSGTMAVAVDNTTTTTQGDLNVTMGLSATGVVTASGDAHGLATGDSPTFAGLTINGSNIVFEGATANAFETSFVITDPTADRTITFPDSSGTVAFISGSDILTINANSGTSTLQSGDTLTITGGTYLTAGVSGDTVTINHDNTTRTDTTSTDAPSHGGTFEAVTSVTTNATGHVTAIDVSTITIPAEADTLSSVLGRGNTANTNILPDSTANNRNIGSATAIWNTVYATTFDGTATQAQYADLAEKYLADDIYGPGTVIAVGGDAEVTAAHDEIAHSVLGVVSTAPAFLMNKDLVDGTAIALKGRVPVKCIGTVRKGDRLAPSHFAGYATVDNSRTAWSFAIALEDGEDGLVEAIIL